MAVELIKNERVIQALKPGAGRLSDGGGLYLLPFAKGDSHYWRFDYTYNGKRKTLSIGVYPHVSLAGARESAAAVRVQLANSIDPSDGRKQSRQQLCVTPQAEGVSGAGTSCTGSFESFARRWFDIKKGQWMETYSTKVIRRLELHGFPRLGHVPIENVTPKMVLDACRAVERNDALETAHRLREHCSSVFRFAIAEGNDLRDPCADIRDALKRPQVRHFAAVTKPEPLAELLRSIDAYSGSFVVRSALKLHVMLMLRPGELRQARWEEIDLDNGQFFVPSMRLKRTKVEKENGPPHLVPLATQTVQILEELYEQTGHTDLVFPAKGRAGRCLSENTMNAALRGMGYASDVVCAHGFRATARTMLVEVLGIPESVVEMQLDHAVQDANGTAYNRTEFILKRVEMMQTWASYLEDLKKGQNKYANATLPQFVPVTKRRAPDFGRVVSDETIRRRDSTPC